MKQKVATKTKTEVKVSAVRVAALTGMTLGLSVMAGALLTFFAMQ